MINIVIDANILFSSSTDYTKVHFADKIEPIIEEIESNDLYENVQILIPQIVIDEVFVLQVKKFSDKMANIKSCKFPHFDILAYNDYENYLKTKFNNTIETLSKSDAKCLIIPHPEDKTLKNIIKRAIEKRAPFSGKDGESDKGFKDVLIWESLIRYKNSNKTDTMILYSKDRRLCDKSLTKEFNDVFKDDIHLVTYIEKDGYNTLYNKISELTDKSFKLTFEDKVRMQLLDLLSVSNIEYLFKEETFDDEDGVHTCTDITIDNKKIIEIREDIDDTINFTVQLTITPYASGVSASTYALCDFDVIYYLTDKKFYIKSYENFYGDVILINDCEL